MQTHRSSIFFTKRLRRNLLLALGLVCGLFIVLQAYGMPTPDAASTQPMPELIEEATDGITAQLVDWVSQAFSKVAPSVTL